LRSEAEPACLGTANPNLNDLWFCRGAFVEFDGARGLLELRRFVDLRALAAFLKPKLVQGSISKLKF
jgi:hypothetical protein